jgi:glucan-binding YG repeat protein
VKIEGKKYYFNDKGVMQKGLKTIKDKKYYFDDNGVMQTGLVNYRSKTYYFDKKGVMKTGWQKVNGNKYYFNDKGVAQTGWKTINEKKYYFDQSGIMLKGLQTIKGKTYYLKSGVMKTGWQKVSGKKYYFSSKGVAQTGWKKIDGKKYYFNESGIMLSGLQTIDGKIYYLKSGVMKTGWQKVSGNKYYFSSKGVAQIGWKTIKGKTYYFSSNGIMARNTALFIDGSYYIFDNNGIYDPTKSYYSVKGIKVHPQYLTDPQVSEEQLLATIIYCEAGNQKQFPVVGQVDGNNVTVYKGQLAVGYVIANRMKNGLGYKEVIYQQNQFEPARTGVLTKYLNSYGSVSTECRNAAKIILNDVSKNTCSVSDYTRADCKWNNFWTVNYARTTNFFSVYSDSEYQVIQDHVFFNFTKTVTK